MSELHGDARYLVYGGILFAAWGKSAQLPMQAWLPDAMEAPTPISAYLHAASMVKVGVYIFCPRHYRRRQYPACDWRRWHGHGAGHHSLWISDVFATAGYEAVAGTGRPSLNLAGCSSACRSPSSARGWRWRVASPTSSTTRSLKACFFLVAGALSYSCGTRLLPRLRGVLHTLPLPGVGFCVAALAITGVPPFNGFFSKFPLFAAGFALSVEYWILLPAMILLMIESVASFALGLFAGLVASSPGKPSEAVADAAPLPWSMRPGADCTDCDVADFQRNRRDLVAVRR